MPCSKVWRTLARVLLPVLVVGTSLAGCASRFERTADGRSLRLNVQSGIVAPGNGGEFVTASDLQPGDILLTSGASVRSVGIRLGTFSEVSHAVLYLGDGQVTEAVGEGVRMGILQGVLDEEDMVAAFRVPGLQQEHLERMRAWALAQVGTRYNTVGVLLAAPFVLNRRLCELPLIPHAVSQFCVRGFAAVQLGVSRNDRFFCSQYVLEAFNQAGLPITTADPRWVSPADLLHMREGDVPSIAAARSLQYIGHLKYTPMPAVPAAINKP